MKYSVYAQAMAYQYLGEIEANSPEEAEELANDLYNKDGSLFTNCHNAFDLGEVEVSYEESK